MLPLQLVNAFFGHCLCARDYVVHYEMNLRLCLFSPCGRACRIGRTALRLAAGDWEEQREEYFARELHAYTQRGGPGGRWRGRGHPVNLRLQQRVAGRIEFQSALILTEEQEAMKQREECCARTVHDADDDVDEISRAQRAPLLQRVYRGMPPSSSESALAASREGHFAIAQLLLECGADVNAADE